MPSLHPLLISHAHSDQSGSLVGYTWQRSDTKPPPDSSQQLWIKSEREGITPTSQTGNAHFLHAVSCELKSESGHGWKQTGCTHCTHHEYNSLQTLTWVPSHTDCRHNEITTANYITCKVYFTTFNRHTYSLATTRARMLFKTITDC